MEEKPALTEPRQAHAPATPVEEPTARAALSALQDGTGALLAGLCVSSHDDASPPAAVVATGAAVEVVDEWLGRGLSKLLARAWRSGRAVHMRDQDASWDPPAALVGKIRSVLVVPLLLASGRAAFIAAAPRPFTAKGRDAATAVARTFERTPTPRAGLAALERVLRVTSRAHRVILSAETETDILNGVVSTLTESIGYGVAWVGRAVQGHGSPVRLLAAAGIEAAYARQIKVSWAADDPHGLGPAGRTIRTGRIQAVGDLATDPSFEPWRDIASERGLRSCCCLPLDLEDARGALCVYSSQTNGFTADEVAFLSQLADDISYGLRLARERRAKRRTRHPEQAMKAQLERLFHHAPIGAMLLDADGTVVALHGRFVDDAMTTSVLGHRYQDALRTPRLVDAIDHAFSGKTTEFDLTYGGRVWGLRVAPRDETRHGRGVDVVGVDVTEREYEATKRAVLVHDLQERVKELTALTGVARLLQNPRSTGTADMFGQIAAAVAAGLEFPDVAVVEVVHGETTARAGPSGRPVVQTEVRFATYDATRGRILIGYTEAPERSVPFLPEEDALIGTIADMLRMHLDRRLLEDEGRANARLLDQTERLAQAGSWYLDTRTGSYEVSPELYRVLGLPVGPRGTQQQVVLDRIHPDDRAWVTTRFTEALARGLPYSVQHRVQWPDGTVRWVLAHAELAFDEAGAAIGARGTTQDITERKEAEEREAHVQHLEEMNAFRSEFVNTAAHELNTPLTPIALQLDLLRSGRLGPLTERQTQTVSIIDRNITRLSLLVRDMLDSARLQAGRLKIAKQPTDLVQIVRESVQTYVASAEDNGIRLELRAPEHVETDADPLRIMQVVTNLINNAIKFTPKDGSVLVTVTADDHAVDVSVADSGVGLTETQREVLFKPFVQVHETHAKKGTGLGLYISRGIVEQHGGTISCKSEGTGKGATFAFRLPRHHDAPIQEAHDAA